VSEKSPGRENSGFSRNLTTIQRGKGFWEAMASLRSYEGGGTPWYLIGNLSEMGGLKSEGRDLPKSTPKDTVSSFKSRRRLNELLTKARNLAKTAQKKGRKKKRDLGGRRLGQVLHLDRRKTKELAKRATARGRG